MTARGLLFELARKLRIRARAVTAIEVLAVAVAVALLSATVDANAGSTLLGALVAGLFVGAWRWRTTSDNRLSQGIVARRLDVAFAGLEDSAELLLRERPGLGRLEKLQREIIAARLTQIPESALRKAAQRVSLKTLWPALMFLAVAVLAAVFVVREPGAAGRPVDSGDANPEMAAITLRAVEISVRPPPYTGLAAYRADADATVQEAAVLRWRIQFGGNPDAVSLGFDDDSMLDLTIDADGVWVSDELPARAALYRIETAPRSGSAERLHRIRVVRDEAPLLNWRFPANSVVDVAALSAKAMRVTLRVRDDYAVASVNAVLTLARGSGENVRFRELTRQMQRDDGDATDAEYTLDLDFEELGMEPGDELFVNAEARQS